MIPTGDFPSASTQNFILGIAHFMPHPWPPAHAPGIRKKRKQKAKRKTSDKTSG